MTMLGGIDAEGSHHAARSPWRSRGSWLERVSPTATDGACVRVTHIMSRGPTPTLDKPGAEQKSCITFATEVVTVSWTVDDPGLEELAASRSLFFVHCVSLMF